jgi:hypothetical protein
VEVIRHSVFVPPLSAVNLQEVAGSLRAPVTTVNLDLLSNVCTEA